MKIPYQIILSAATLLSVAACSSENEQKNTFTPTPLNMATPAASDTSAQGTANVNPAHGQPNHRCDIPVGASLDLPAQPGLNMQPTVAPPTPTIKGAVAGGINPPHGQLGHDCSVAVGAPLNK
ncbi:hypothetical protein ACXYMU_01120 [Pontibacter sp. CAU 1760]